MLHARIHVTNVINEMPSMGTECCENTKGVRNAIEQYKSEGNRKRTLVRKVLRDILIVNMPQM